MVRTDSFVGKRKVKDRWEDGGFIVESQLGDWPVYKVRCPSADDRQKPKYRILHQNRLLLVADEDVDDTSGHAQAKATPTLPNATHEALSVGVGSQESLPSLVTRQGVVKWRIPYQALDTSRVRGDTESSRPACG